MSPIKTQFNVAQFGNALEGESDRVKLPFGHIWAYWTNGNSAASKEDGAKFFGGWAADADKLMPDVSSINQTEPPTGFKGPQTWVNREGNEYNVYATRAVYAAPIATRYYFDEKGGHIAVLSYLGTFEKRGEKNILIPYGPGVLTANGYAASRVRDAFKKWQANTAKVRAEFAPGVPANLFYYCIGTFGDKRNQEMVGKRSQSPIIPAQVRETDWNENTLELHFVGDTVAAIMLDLKAQAAEWLADIPKQADKANGIRPNASIDEINAALGGTDEFGI
jgi:hypothetical protein